MKQEDLTNRVVKTLFLYNNSTNAIIIQTPVTLYLPIDDQGEPAQGVYNYASVVGMLNCLQDHFGIDITFTISQVARYDHSPKCSHKLAL